MKKLTRLLQVGLAPLDDANLASGCMCKSNDTGRIGTSGSEEIVVESGTTSVGRSLFSMFSSGIGSCP